MTSHLNSLAHPLSDLHGGKKSGPGLSLYGCKALTLIFGLAVMLNAWAEISESTLSPGPSALENPAAHSADQPEMVEIPLPIPPLNTPQTTLAASPTAPVSAAPQTRAAPKPAVTPAVAAGQAATPVIAPSANTTITSPPLSADPLPAQEQITLTLADPPPAPSHVDITDPDNTYYIYPDDAPRADIEPPALVPALDMRASSAARSPMPAAPAGRFGFVLLTTVKFDFNKAELKPETQRALDQAADYISRHPELQRVLLLGHADEVGSQRYNYSLSDQRVSAVHTYLVNHGINPLVLYPAGRGEKQAIDEPWTYEGRGRNRRVEIYVIHPVAQSALSNPQP